MSSNRVSTLQMGGGPADHYASCYNLIFRDPAVQHLWGVGASPAMPGRALRAPHQAPSGLDLSASIADAFAAVPLRAALAIQRGRGWWGWLAVPFILARRSRDQGLRVLCTLASSRPSSNL